MFDVPDIGLGLTGPSIAFMIFAFGSIWELYVLFKGLYVGEVEVREQSIFRLDSPFKFWFNIAKKFVASILYVTLTLIVFATIQQDLLSAHPRAEAFFNQVSFYNIGFLLLLFSCITFAFRKKKLKNYKNDLKSIKDTVSLGSRYQFIEQKEAPAQLSNIKSGDDSILENAEWAGYENIREANQYIKHLLNWLDNNNMLNSKGRDYKDQADSQPGPLQLIMEFLSDEGINFMKKDYPEWYETDGINFNIDPNEELLKSSLNRFKNF